MDIVDLIDLSVEAVNLSMICRACKCARSDVVFDLGNQVLASTFIKEPIGAEHAIPLTIVKCANPECGLVQLTNTVCADSMYKSMQYGYRSGLNASMVKHLGELVKYVLSFTESFKDQNCMGATVIDIGSNDSTLLSSYPKYHGLWSIHKVGIDPTGEQFREFYKGSEITLIPDYFTKENFQKVYGTDIKAQCITSISMFYDLPDPQQFVHDIASVLDETYGVWVMEQSYVYSMIDNNSFDTACHEHLEYYGLKQIEFLCRNAGLRIVHVEFNDCNGGSFRVAIAHDTPKSLITREYDNLVYSILMKEEGLEDDLTLWGRFQERCNIQKRRLVNLLSALKASGKSVSLYGASTKGNTLLQYYGIDHTMVDSALEKNNNKFGCLTPGTNIPIVSEEETLAPDFRGKKPDFMLVLPWHFKANFLEKSGLPPMIFPLPEVELVSVGKKVALITGVTGQIGRHLAKLLLEKGYIVFGTSTYGGTSTSKKYVDGVIMFHMDSSSVLCRSNWNDILVTIQPHEIYHLAGMTSSIDSIQKPLYTMDANAQLPMLLLDIIATNSHLHKKTKFFAANSIEIYKGLKDVDEISINSPVHPTTPYGISKVTALWAHRYYRTLGVKSYVGILTNTESAMRSPFYVTRKISEFMKYKDIVVANNDVPYTLYLGDISTRRDWIHANDAARAMISLLNQEIGEEADECIIATGQTRTIKEFVDEAIKQSGLVGSWSEDGWVWIGTDAPAKKKFVITSGKSQQRWYEANGFPDLNVAPLMSLGWAPEYDLARLVGSMLA
jgi:NDP-4-keto-2,6-dideoxyhexose 3-C-methyltransferase